MTENTTHTTVDAPDEGRLVSTRERLLSVAASLFREKGYAGTTTRALSSLAGIQNSSLYHHVGGKEDLLYGLCVGALKDVARLFDTVAAAPGNVEPIDRLQGVARGYVELALRDRDRHATMLAEIRSLSRRRRAAVVELRDANVSVVESLIREAQQCGQVRTDIEAKYLTLALFNLLNWTIFWFDSRGELAEDQIAEILWSVFFSGTGTASSDNERPGTQRATGAPPGKAAPAKGATQAPTSAAEDARQSEPSSPPPTAPARALPECPGRRPDHA